MRTVIVGAGPTGLYLATALAHRGHEVLVVDRDPGPVDDVWWDRPGVMQLHHPHGFRRQAYEALDAETPEITAALAAAGIERIVTTPVPGGPTVIAGFRCRRMVFDRILRAVAAATPGVTLRVGHVNTVLAEGRRATGVLVDGARVEADLVLDASGRAGRIGRTLRAPAEGGECGQAYTSRQYRLRPGAEWGPMTMPRGAVVAYPGYLAIVFPHDAGVFSVLLVRAAGDPDLRVLREPAAFETAVAAIPLHAAWTDPARAEPLTPVLPGGALYNTYRGQLGEDRTVALPGLLFVGDTVCTTNPAAGRGVSLSLLQAQALLGLLDEHPRDPSACALAFDGWCREHIRPWFEDHVSCDAGLARRWAGEDIGVAVTDTAHPLPSDLVRDAAEADPSLMSVVGPYLAMDAMPASLAAIEPRARAIYASGWRPSVPSGPSRDELAALVGAASSERALA
jgi:2-polyprenyl-6-methoxyphenol hydroxylase-like FAD-dependent oxidoreductase